MAKTLGDATVATDRSHSDQLKRDRPGFGSGSGPVPPAIRGLRPGWRDPRLWVGVIIVAASVVVGARVLSAADDTVQVWAAAADMGAGQTIAADDLVAERVHFASAGPQRRYFAVDQTLPADLQLTRSVGAGELLARSAVGTATTSGLLEVPIAVDPEQVPASVAAGSVVDVYVIAPTSAVAGGGTDAGAGETGAGDVGSGTATAPRTVSPALAAATVVDAPQLSTTFGSTGKRQLVLAVKDAQVQAFFALLARYDSPVLTVVRRG